MDYTPPLFTRLYSIHVGIGGASMKNTNCVVTTVTGVCYISEEMIRMRARVAVLVTEGLKMEAVNIGLMSTAYRVSGNLQNRSSPEQDVLRDEKEESLRYERWATVEKRADRSFVMSDGRALRTVILRVINESMPKKLDRRNVTLWKNGAPGQKVGGLSISKLSWRSGSWISLGSLYVFSQGRLYREGIRELFDSFLAGYKVGSGELHRCRGFHVGCKNLSDTNTVHNSDALIMSPLLERQCKGFVPENCPTWIDENGYGVGLPDIQI
nr:hypothetical protein Iba_chr11bCG9370 [Ipomoea batatas]